MASRVTLEIRPSPPNGQGDAKVVLRLGRSRVEPQRLGVFGDRPIDLSVVEIQRRDGIVP